MSDETTGHDEFWRAVRAHLPDGVALIVRPHPDLPNTIIVGVTLGMAEAWHWVPSNMQDDLPAAEGLARLLAAVGT